MQHIGAIAKPALCGSTGAKIGAALAPDDLRRRLAEHPLKPHYLVDP